MLLLLSLAPRTAYRWVVACSKSLVSSLECKAWTLNLTSMTGGISTVAWTRFLRKMSSVHSFRSLMSRNNRAMHPYSWGVYRLSQPLWQSTWLGRVFPSQFVHFSAYFYPLSTQVSYTRWDSWLCHLQFWESTLETLLLLSCQLLQVSGHNRRLEWGHSESTLSRATQLDPRHLLLPQSLQFCFLHSLARHHQPDWLAHFQLPLF